MPTTRKWFAGLLFWVQLTIVLLFSGSIIWRSRTDVTGTSLVFFCLTAVYLVLSVWLADGAHRSKSSSLGRQVLVLYYVRFILVMVIIGVVARNSGWQWNGRELAQVLFALTLTVLVVVTAKTWNKPLHDPMITAFFAIVFTSVAQLLLAWKFWVEGVSGTPGLAVVMGHVALLVRLAHIQMLVGEDEDERNRKWILISEIVNWATWAVVTLVWWYKTYIAQ